MGVKLTKAGIADFTIFEAHGGPGGTWWANDYPGAEVDVDSSIYSFSFNSHNWSRTHAGQAELLEYIKQTVDDFDLAPHFRYNTRISDVIWDDAAQLYTITTQSGEAQEFEIVVSAVGMLSDPKHPAWAGLEEFAGERFHTSQWRHDLDLAGKRVAIVGVGSTSVQIIPKIAPMVEQLYVVQREPGWVLPKHARDLTAEERLVFDSPIRRAWRRLKVMSRSEWQHTWQPIYVVGNARSERARSASLAFIDRVFADRPDLKAAVTPTYTFSAKRRVAADDYYPTLLRDNVELVTARVARVTPAGIVTDDGREVPIDVLITATGFKASQYLSSLNVIGRDGAVLAETWKLGAAAFLGISVPKFPNLFIMYGPNTNGGGPITSMLELQSAYIVAEIRRMMRRSYTSLEVKPEVNARYQRWIQGRMTGTAWLEGKNYFTGPQGQVVTQWRDGAVLYSFMLRTRRRTASIARRVSIERAEFTRQAATPAVSASTGSMKAER
ncbi:MAG: Alpha/beta hydrolase protein [Microbacteriaceae bacterium]|nr:Alpha/beta hydrolase protein [Microbacteriaceae bacterium]